MSMKLSFIIACVTIQYTTLDLKNHASTGRINFLFARASFGAGHPPRLTSNGNSRNISPSNSHPPLA